MTGSGLAVGGALRRAVEARLRDVLGRAVTVPRVERLAGGASRETWAVDAVVGGAGRRRLVLRRCRPDAPRPSLALEADAATVAGAAGVPVAPVVYATDSAEDMGGPYLLAEQVDGETVPRRVFRLLDGVEGGRLRVGRAAAAVLARLHSMPTDAVAGLPASGDPVAERRRDIDDAGVASPAFELALRWLDAHRPRPRPWRVVHGDFRVGNLVVGRRGLSAVLDWEHAHVGDPLEDLGWFCARPWRFGEDTLGAGGLLAVEDWLAAYEEAAGREVDRDALAWWEAMANLHWGVICASQAARHLSGAERSVGLAAVGRRRSEAEWDTLECLRRAGWS